MQHFVEYQGLDLVMERTLKMDGWLLALIFSLAAVTSTTASTNAVQLALLSRDIKTSCLFRGKYYQANSSFVTLDCSMLCYCMGNGATSCMNLCSPLSKGECPLGMKIQDEKEPAGPRDSDCQCVKRYCVAAYCYTDKFEKYKIGESYRRGNCSEICICKEDGTFKCKPACPKKECPAGYKLKTGKKTSVRFGCPCKKQRCILKRRRACHYNGQIYTSRRYFETNNCQSKCRCRRSGVIKCSPLCPPTKTPKCRPNEIMDKLYVAPPHIAKGRCQCLKRVCVSSIVVHNRLRRPKLPKLRTCKAENRTLLPGQRYITDACSERCQCTVFGHLVCIPLCLSPVAACSSDEEPVLVRRPVRRSKCSCIRTTCRPRNALDKRESECREDGHIFTQGIEYVDRNCTKRCECTKAGRSKCRPLCPVTNLTRCRNGFVKSSRIRVPKSPWCSCTVNNCIALQGFRLT